jgi:hypothetical protein
MDRVAALVLVDAAGYPLESTRYRSDSALRASRA